MKKQIKDFKVNYELDWVYEVNIEKLEKDIKALKKLGTTKIVFNTELDYDSIILTIEAIQKRTETDKEYKQRVDEIKYQEEKIKKEELNQLANLKIKYKNHEQ